MIYGDVTTVPRYEKPLAISLIVIITFSSDGGDREGMKTPQKKEKRKKERKKKFTFSGSGNHL